MENASLFDINSNFEERKHYELSFLLIVLVYVPLGWFYCDYIYQFESDGFFNRLPLTIVAAISLFLSKKEYLSVVNTRLIIFILSIWITGDFAIAGENEGHHILFLTGNIQTPLIVSFGFYHRRDALLYFLINMFVGTYYFKEHEFMSKYYPLLVGTYYLVHFVFLSNKKNLVDNLVKNNSILAGKTQDLITVNNKISQAAHDIRSPVMALDAIAKSLQTEDVRKKQMLSDISQRINKIADELLKTYRENLDKETTYSNNKTEAAIIESSPIKNTKNEHAITDTNLTFSYNPSISIHSVVSEKQAVYRREVEFSIHVVQVDQILSLKLEEDELKRILSNVINNSIEAFPEGRGKIGVIATDGVSDIKINIQDNGIGMPSNVKEQVTKKGFTHGKEKGTGLGLNHAKETLNAVDGSLSILSKEGMGTLIVLTIPKS